MARTMRPGLGADVGAAVAADLGLVAHAAEGDADELAAEGAGDRLAERRLADAGRADEGEDGAGLAARGALLVDAPLGRSLRTARSSTMRSFTSSRPVWSASRVARATVDVELVGRCARSTAGRARCRASPGSSRAPCSARASARSGRAPCAGPARRPRPRRPPRGRRCARGSRRRTRPRVVVAQLLADGLHLAAEEVLALLLVEPVADVVADLLGQLALGQGLLGPAEHEAHALGDVDRLEQLDLALGGELRPPADQVGQAAGVVGVDAAEDAADLPVTEVLEQGAQRGAQLGAERLGLVGRGRLRRRGSAVTHSPAPVPTTPAPRRARPVARTTRAWVPPGSTPVDSTRGEGADAWRSGRRPWARAAARRRCRRRRWRRPWPRRTRR